jgi:hypothetical protein
MVWLNLSSKQWHTQKGGQVLTPNAGQETVIQVVPLNLLSDLPTKIKHPLRFQQATQDLQDNDYLPIEIYVYSDNSWELGDGNHRLEAARQLNLQAINVVFTYVD